MRQILSLLIGGIAVVLFVLFASLAPADASKDEPAACNPCDCPEDNRENCQGIEFYAFYAREINRQCTFDFYRFNGDGQGRRVMRIRERTLENLATPEVNTLIRESEGISLYHLTSGEFQVSAGPDLNGKVYYVVFNLGCPADVNTEGSWEAR
jgi:hypothetical protein